MIERNVRDGIVVLTMAHGKANAVDLALLQALDEALQAAAADEAVRGVVITGRGAIFSAGVDLFQVLEGGDAYLEAFLPMLSRALGTLFAFPRPTVAAVNGHAIAGGCLLAAACHHAVSADGKGKLGLTELRVGVPFPACALEIIRHRLGDRRTAQLVLEGRLLPPAEAREIGLVDAVVPEATVLDDAIAKAKALSSIPAEAFALTQRQLRGGVVAGLEGAPLQGIDAEARAVWAQPETLARIKAFLDATVGRKRG